MLRHLFLAIVFVLSNGLADSGEAFGPQVVVAVQNADPQNPTSQETPSSIEPSAKLTWSDGASLPGKWQGADSESIHWMADSLFRDSVQIDRRYLSQIDLPLDSALEAKQNISPTMYLIQGVDGGRLFGEIRNLDTTHWTVFAPRFGEVKLLRSSITAVQNLANVGQWTAGRFDLAQWDSARGQKRFWQVNSQGQLLSTRQNIHLYREAELPESSLIELEIQWSKKLDFMLGLGVPKNARETDQLPRLETWDDALVFSYGDNFEIVMESFVGSVRRIRLLLHWDQMNKKVAVHDESGKLLCTADLSELKTRSKPGIYIENKAGDLTISELRIRQSEPGFDSTRPSYQVNNQPATNGRIVSFDGEHWTIELPSENAEAPAEVLLVPSAEFSNAFSLHPPIANQTVATQVEYQDGMFVVGELQKFDGQRITLLTNASPEPLDLQIDGIRQVKFPPQKIPANDQDFTHQMSHLAGTIVGRLEPGSQIAGDIVQWRLPGASQSVPFASAHAKIVLKKRQASGDSEEQWPDTMYFYNRDRIPCRVLNINDGIVHFESFTERSQVESSLLKALDFSSAYLQAEIKPQDVQWSIPEKSRPAIEIKEEEIQVTDSATLSHANLLRTGGFEFEFKWKPSTYGTLELELFGDTRLDRPGSVKLTLYFYDTNVMVMSQVDQIQRQQVAAKHQTKIRVQVDGITVKLWVGNQQVATQQIPVAAARGTGVKWTFNRVTDEKFVGRISQVQHLKASERGDAGMVATEQKDLLLTIPRIRKNNPPLHILRAINGDMVRGELVSLDQEAIHFNANHEALRFPRALVSSLIWLHFQANEPADSSASLPKNEAPVSAPDPIADGSVGAAIESPITDDTDHLANALQQTVQVLVAGDRRLTFDLTAWRNDQLIGQSMALGECAIPLEQIEELRFGSFANQALDVPYSDWVARLAPEPQMMGGADGDQRSDMLFGTRSPLIGSELPDLPIAMLDGETIGLRSMVGKVVVLDFWATWCSPCIRAMPELIAATGEFSSDDVMLLAVNQEEDVNTIKNFLSGRDWSVQVGLDNGTLARRLQVQSLPQTVVVGPDGKIAFVKVGFSNDIRQSLQKAISSLLEQ